MVEFVHSDMDILGGTPVFVGTRVPVSVLFKNLADGLSVDEILDSYPTLSREIAESALAAVCQSLDDWAKDTQAGLPRPYASCWVRWCHPADELPKPL